MKKILILLKTEDKRFEAFKRVQKNVPSKTYELTVSTYRNIHATFSTNKLSVYIENVSISEYDAIYFYKMYGYEELVTLINIFVQKNSKEIVILDSAVKDNMYWIDRKSWEYTVLSTNGVPIIPTTLCVGEALSKYVKNFPCIIKQTNLSEGKGVWLCKTEEDRNELSKKLSTEVVLIQPFIRNIGDIRIIVIGNKIHGSMLRKNASDYRNNIALGGSGTVIAPPKDLEDLAKKAANILGYDIAGVDLIQDEESKNWYVMEVNKGPNFDGFDLIHETDTSEAIVTYLDSLLNT